MELDKTTLALLNLAQRRNKTFRARLYPDNGATWFQWGVGGFWDHVRVPGLVVPQSFDMEHASIDLSGAVGMDFVEAETGHLLRVRHSGFPADDYMLAPFPDTEQPGAGAVSLGVPANSPEFARLVALEKVIGENSSRAALECVQVQNGYAVTTNGRIAVKASILAPDGKYHHDAIRLARTLKAKKATNLTICPGNGENRVYSDQYRACLPCATSDLPSFDDVVPSGEAESANTSSVKELIQALKWLPGEFVKLVFGDGGVKLLPRDYNDEAPGYSSDYLTTILGCMDAKGDVTFHHYADRKPLKITQGQTTALIMPVTRS